LRIFIKKPNPLIPPLRSLRSKGKTLAIPELRELLEYDSLGRWALDAETITVFWDFLWQSKPRIILECGSGVSTLVLGAYATLNSAKEGQEYNVISLEQDKQLRDKIEVRLKNKRLDRFVKVLHAPLDSEGNYDIATLERTLSPRTVNLLLIDGPFGAMGRRIHTLPELKRFCSDNARWFLDDAFRDGEISILHQWQRLTGVIVDGIYPVGKGLATGRVANNNSSSSKVTTNRISTFHQSIIFMSGSTSPLEPYCMK
jgi:hypothetical protein